MPCTTRELAYANTTANAGLAEDRKSIVASTSSEVTESRMINPSGLVAAASSAVTSVTRGGLGTIRGNRMMSGVTQVMYGYCPVKSIINDGKTVATRRQVTTS